MTVVADTVLGFFDSHQGPIAGPYGGASALPGHYFAQSPWIITDGSRGDYLSLPAGSHVELAWSGRQLIDGPGSDLVIYTPYGSGERALIYVSTDDGASFQFLTSITESGTGFANSQAFDLSALPLAPQVPIDIVRVVGADLGGSAPGFDLVTVEAVDTSLQTAPILPARIVRGDDTDNDLDARAAGSVLIGLAGNDLLTGSASDDILKGGRNRDTLAGGAGYDLIIGGRGADQLRGDAGADVFHFAAGDGRDVIADFEDGIDLISLDDKAGAFAKLVITQAGQDVRIDYLDGHIRLLGHDVSEIDASDFI